MRLRSLVVVAVLALVLPAANAGAAKPKFVRVVKRQGAFTAIVTYTARRGSYSYLPVSDVTLRIRHSGHLVLRRQICQLEPPVYEGCRWGGAPSLATLRVGPSDAPAFALDLWNGGNKCCDETFIAVLGRRIAWITHVWSGADGWVGYGVKRIRGRTVLLTGDGRFYCAFARCAADGAVPIRVFAINRYYAFANVTRHFPGLIRANAHHLAALGGPHATIRKQSSGVLASWCADMYLLGHGRRCARVLAYAVRHRRPNMMGAEPTRRFVRGLNRDLERWGYKR